MPQRPALYIQVYTAFFTTSHIHVKGRLLKDKPLINKEYTLPANHLVLQQSNSTKTAYHSIWKSLFHTMKRAFGRELPHQALQITIGKQVIALTTDKEGYFEWYTSIPYLPKGKARTIKITAFYQQQEHTLPVPLQDFSNIASTGIISDIDDTIMVTGVKSFFKLKVVFNTLFLDPFRRQPIENAAAAFRHLSSQRTERVPIIYLSNSPWNLYNYLHSFLQHNKFPKGIVILRDMGWQLLRSRSLEEGNKYKEIQRTLVTFSTTSFILIGDSGELDFDIYKKILKEYPDRIQRIIINKVGNKEKEAAILKFAQQHPIVELVQGYSSLLAPKQEQLPI